MSLSMKLLGPPQIEVDGRPLQVDTRKATALLAYLAVEGGPLPRDRLVDLLWPDSDVDRARSSLRRTLSTIRTALDGRWLISDRQVVQLDDADVEIDVHTIERILALHDHPDRNPCSRCRRELEPVAELLGSSFLDGFAIRGSEPFERWMVDSSERIGQRLDRAADLLERALIEAGEVTGAVELTRRRLACNPLSEEVARSQMHHLARAGDRTGAIDSYRRLVAVLDDELGVPPLAETTELYHAILEGAVRPEPSRDRQDSEPRLREVDFPLVARDHVLAAIDEHVARTGLVLVQGTTGIGKSRLLDEVCSRLRARGDTVLTGVGRSGQAEIPFGLLHHALAPALERLDLDELPERVLNELSQLFPTLATTSLPTAGTKTALYDALAATLTWLGRCTLVVDDLDHADAASIEAVCFLVDHHTKPIRVVASTAGDGPTRSADDRSTPGLADLVQRAATIRLDPLDAESIQALAQSADRRIDSEKLLRDTQGLPLLVVESLRSTRDRDLPESVRRLFESKLASLSGTAAQILDVLVVLAAPTTPATARSASGRSPDETDVALDELIGGGLINETAHGIEVAYTHVSSLVEATMTPPRRRLIHRRCAEALTAVAADPIRIARHLVAAGNAADASTWFERSGDAARSLLAHDEALAAYESALAAGHGDRAGLHVKLAVTAMHGGDYERAIEHYEAALATGAGEQAMFELGALYRRLRRWDLAAAHLRGIDVDGAPDGLAAKTCAELAVIDHRRGVAVAARDLADRALDRARRCGEPDVIAMAENAAAIVGRPPGREQHLRAAIGRATDPRIRTAVLNNLAATLADAGEAVEAARDAAEIADALGDRHVAAAVHNTFADALRRAGRDAEARVELTRSVELFSSVTTGTNELDPHIWMLADL